MLCPSELQQGMLSACVLLVCCLSRNEHWGLGYLCCEKLLFYALQSA